MERLEHFLEREYHVTQDCAGIGQDPGLMGRVGRVVLCGERDGVLFRGMSLNQICLELDGETRGRRCLMSDWGLCWRLLCEVMSARGSRLLEEQGFVLLSDFHISLSCSSLTSVMSGNSADSYSEGESEGEHVKEKPEGPITAAAAAPDPPPTLLYVRKGKNNGRVGRPKKLKNSQPALPPPPPPPVHRRRGSGLQEPKLVIYNSHVILQRKQNGRMSVLNAFFPGKRGVLKRPWSEAERAAVEEHLTQNITELRVPAKADCERCLQQCPLLVNNHRDWRAIKFYCHNRIQLLKKNQRRENELQPLIVC